MVPKDDNKVNLWEKAQSAIAPGEIPGASIKISDDKITISNDITKSMTGFVAKNMKTDLSLGEEVEDSTIKKEFFALNPIFDEDLVTSTRAIADEGLRNIANNNDYMNLLPEIQRTELVISKLSDTSATVSTRIITQEHKEAGWVYSEKPEQALTSTYTADVPPDFFTRYNQNIAAVNKEKSFIERGG